VATNKYFNLYKQKQEQDLLEGLIEEAIKIHGIDAVYLPRKHMKVDGIYREDPLSYFNDYHHIEVYIKNVDGFQGDGELFSKFGLDIKSQITFCISRSSFAKTVGEEMIRPNEGDLIYIPMSNADGLYEIRFVSNKSVFYNLGEFYMYDLQCELFAFQDENVKTGIAEIDRMADEGSQNILIPLGAGSGTFLPGEIAYQGPSALGADAKATVINVDASRNLVVKDVFGSFDVGYGPIKGEKSGSNFIMRPDLKTDITNDFGAQNQDMSKDSIIDFTEGNPFSEEGV